MNNTSMVYIDIITEGSVITIDVIGNIDNMTADNRIVENNIVFNTIMRGVLKRCKSVQKIIILTPKYPKEELILGYLATFFTVN